MEKLKNKAENYFRQAKSALEVQYSALPPKKEILDRTLGKEVRPRKSLDITPAQLLYGLRECAVSRESERKEVEKNLLQAFYKNVLESTVESPLIFGLCVRTIYEATLKALNLPKESVVLMSAVTIQDMVVITEAQGLKVVGVDLNLKSICPDAAELDRIATKFAGRAKVFVLAHLFGARADTSKLIEVCRKHNIIFIEDCAESWAGPGVFLGNDQSDVVLFSFGTIKIATALGGAIGRFKNLSLMNRVNTILNGYPVRSVSVDASRFAKYAVLNEATKNDRLFGTVVRGLQAVGLDHDQIIRTFSRGFSRDQDLFPQIRQRPTVPTLKLILKRMQEFDFDRAEQRRQAGRQLTAEMSELLGTKDVTIPGDLSLLAAHEYWLFPVGINNPDVDLREVEKRMLQDGFDVTGGTTQLASLDMVVMDPKDPDFDIPHNARKLMNRILYLPLGDGAGGAPMRRRLIKSLGRAIGVLDDEDDEDEDDDDDAEQLDRPEENELEWFDSDDEEQVAKRKAKL